MGDSYIYKNQKKLRWGYTTGTCAAAASLAAAVMLLQGRRMEQVSLTTPKGIRLDLEVEEMDPGENSVSCGVRKDAGDDPDVTDGSGKIGGTIIGGLIIGVLNNGLNLLNVNSFWQYVVKGTVILLAVFVDYLRNKKAE